MPGMPNKSHKNSHHPRKQFFKTSMNLVVSTDTKTPSNDGFFLFRCFNVSEQDMVHLLRSHRLHLPRHSHVPWFFGAVFLGTELEISEK